MDGWMDMSAGRGRGGVFVAVVAHGWQKLVFPDCTALYACLHTCTQASCSTTPIGIPHHTLNFDRPAWPRRDERRIRWKPKTPPQRPTQIPIDSSFHTTPFPPPENQSSRSDKHIYLSFSYPVPAHPARIGGRPSAGVALEKHGSQAKAQRKWKRRGYEWGKCFFFSF